MTSTARRAQIVEATIEVIAAEGFGQASFARIAEHAGLSSTRLISYHFAGKGELIAAVVQDVFTSIGQFMAQRVGQQPHATGMLRAYIEAIVDFISSQRAQMKALLEIVLAGGLRYEQAADQTAVSHLEAILHQGQDNGEFRDFDSRVVATVIQRAVEALPFLLDAHPELDCRAYGRELVTLFELGTRRSPA